MTAPSDRLPVRADEPEDVPGAANVIALPHDRPGGSGERSRPRGRKEWKEQRRQEGRRRRDPEEPAADPQESDEHSDEHSVDRFDPVPDASPKLLALSVWERFRHPQHWSFFQLSLVLALLVPALVYTPYLVAVQSNQYIAETQLNVRSAERATTDGLSLITGLSTNSQVMSDSAIVVNFIRSREIIDEIRKKLDVVHLYSRPEIDYFSRFDSSKSVDEFVAYWQRMVLPTFDQLTGIITLQVYAFDPNEAAAIAKAILERCDALVNRLSAEAREDAVRSARYEVERAEARLKLVRAALDKFRIETSGVDPLKAIESRTLVIASLESEASKLEAEVKALQKLMSQNTPTINVALGKLEALRKQIAAEKERVAEDTRIKDPKTGSLVAQMEALVAERDFAQFAFNSALTSLETARSQADRKNRFLEVFVNPSVPQASLYPDRPWRWVAVMIFLFIGWALFYLFGTVILERLR